MLKMRLSWARLTRRVALLGFRRWFPAGAAIIAIGCVGAGPASGGLTVGASTRPLPEQARRATAGLATGSIVGVSWLNTRTGWALTRVACGAGACPRLARTNNAGRTWTLLPKLPGRFPGNARTSCSFRACISAVAFATPSIGYLFGPSLLMTRDGGLHWTDVPGPPVLSLDAGPHTATRLIYSHEGCPGPCEQRVETAASGSADWRVALGRIPAAGGAELIRTGDPGTIYVPALGGQAAGVGSQKATIYRSLDEGLSWSTLPDPCPGARLAVEVAAAPEGFLAALCSSRVPNESEAYAYSVVTSHDRGRRWGADRPLSSPLGHSFGLIASPGPGRLVVGELNIRGEGRHTYRLIYSRDEGRHWSTVATERAHLGAGVTCLSALAFDSASEGHWVCSPHAIWTTTDGGSRWIRRPFP